MTIVQPTIIRRYAEAIQDRLCDVLHFAKRKNVWFTIYELAKLSRFTARQVRANLYRPKIQSAGLEARTCKPRRGCYREYQIKGNRWNNLK